MAKEKVSEKVSHSLMDFIRLKKKKKEVERIESEYKNVCWEDVDLTKVRRRVEDRLRKDPTATRLVAVLLEVKLAD